MYHCAVSDTRNKTGPWTRRAGRGKGSQANKLDPARRGTEETSVIMNVVRDDVTVY